MKTINPDQKKIRARAVRNYRALLNEKKKRGFYDDGGGKRYRIGVDFLTAGATEESVEYFRWFEKEFSDDVGEPIFFLHWALAEYRSGNLREASRRLKIAMVSNLYMLPCLLQEPQERLDIWHSSNWQEPEYVQSAGELSLELGDAERIWVREQYASPSFQLVLGEFIAVHKALLHEKDYASRCEILDRWRKFEVKHLELGA